MNGFQNFFGNRYGMDALNFTIAGLALVLSIVGRFFPQVIALPILGMLLIILLFYRMLSTKHVLRRAENEKFLSFWSAVRGWFQSPYLPFLSRGGKRYFRCPNCKQKCREPAGKGMIAIRCPRCGQEFIKRT